MSKESEANVIKLVAWTFYPHPEDAIHGILAGIEDQDLVALMQVSKKSAAGRIAWAEYGRRQGFIDFSVRTVRSEDQLTLEFEGYGMPIHESPLFELNIDEN